VAPPKVEQPKVHRSRHGLVARVVRVQMIAAVIGRLHPGRMVRIPEHPIEIQHAVERRTSADPVIQRLPFGLAVRRVIRLARSLERRERCAIDAQALAVGTLDQLGERPAKIIAAHGFTGSVEGTGQPDVVDTFQHDHLGDAGLRKHIPIESGQGIGPDDIMQESIATDPLVEHGHGRTRGALIEPLRQLIGPAPEGVLRRCVTVGDGIPESDDRSGGPRRPDVDAGEYKK
jgi:hypothetical protein